MAERCQPYERLFFIPYCDDFDQNRSKDSQFVTLFSRPLTHQHNGHDLTYAGYERAIHLYGGEQELCRNLQSVATSFAAFCRDCPDVISAFRKRIEKTGYDNPIDQTLSRTIFVLEDKARLGRFSEAKQAVRINPQPPWLLEIKSHPINTERWPVFSGSLQRFLLDHRVAQLLPSTEVSPKQAPTFRPVLSVHHSTKSTSIMEEKVDIDLTMSEPSSPIGKVNRHKRASDLLREPVSGPRSEKIANIHDTEPTGQSPAAPTRFWGRPAEFGLVAKRKTPAHDNDTVVGILTDLQEQLKSGDLSATALDKMVRKNIDRWVATAIDEASATATKKKTRPAVRVTESTSITASNEFLLKDYTESLAAQNKAVYSTPGSLSVDLSGHFIHRGNKWQLIGWKGRALVAPLPVVKLMNDFLVSAILCHEYQYTWTLRTVRHLFRVGSACPTFHFDRDAIHTERLDGSHSSNNLFISVAQQQRLFAALDAIMQPDAEDGGMSVMFIIAAAAATAELLGKEKKWQDTFTISSKEYGKRGGELINNVPLLEGIIGPASEWGVRLADSPEIDPEDTAGPPDLNLDGDAE